MSVRVPPQPDDVAAYVTVRLHATGAVSTSGHIGDKRMALRLLDIARAAIQEQVRDTGLVIPNRDVDVAPAIPLIDMGSLEPDQRGDP